MGHAKGIHTDVEGGVDVDKEYIDFLNKKIASHDTKFQKVTSNYQETGEKRYYTAQINEEYYTKALNSALATEKKRDLGRENQSRAIGALLNSAEQYKAIYPAEEALEKIINDLTLAKIFC